MTNTQNVVLEVWVTAFLIALGVLVLRSYWHTLTVVLGIPLAAILGTLLGLLAAMLIFIALISAVGHELERMLRRRLNRIRRERRRRKWPREQHPSYFAGLKRVPDDLS